MTRSKNTHAILLEYLVLISALLIFGVFIFLYQKDQVYRDAMVVLLGSFYVAWGVAHHIRHARLTLRIVLEYVFVALLGCLMLATMFL